MKARTVVGRGEKKSLLSDPGSELRLLHVRREKEEESCQDTAACPAGVVTGTAVRDSSRCRYHGN